MTGDPAGRVGGNRCSGGEPHDGVRMFRGGERGARSTKRPANALSEPCFPAAVYDRCFNRTISRDGGGCLDRQTSTISYKHRVILAGLARGA